MRNLRRGNDAGLSGSALNVITGVFVGRRQREIQVQWKGSKFQKQTLESCALKMEEHHS